MTTATWVTVTLSSDPVLGLWTQYSWGGGWGLKNWWPRKWSGRTEAGDSTPLTFKVPSRTHSCTLGTPLTPTLGPEVPAARSSPESVWGWRVAGTARTSGHSPVSSGPGQRPGTTLGVWVTEDVERGTYLEVRFRTRGPTTKRSWSPRVRTSPPHRTRSKGSVTRGTHFWGPEGSAVVVWGNGKGRTPGRRPSVGTSTRTSPWVCGTGLDCRIRPTVGRTSDFLGPLWTGPTWDVSLCLPGRSPPLTPGLLPSSDGCRRAPPTQDSDPRPTGLVL